MLRRRRQARALGNGGQEERRVSNDSDPWQEVDLRFSRNVFESSAEKQFRPGHIVVEEGSQRASDRDNDSFASADDIGVLNEAFDDAIDNLTRFGDSIEEIFTFLIILNS